MVLERQTRRVSGDTAVGTGEIMEGEARHDFTRVTLAPHINFLLGAEAGGFGTEQKIIKKRPRSHG